MKQQNRIYIFLFSIFFGIAVSYGQTAKEDFKQRKYRPKMENFEKFVKEAYGKTADENVFDEPSRLRTLKNIYKNNIVIVETSQEVPAYFPDLSSVPLLKRYNPSITRTSFSIETFNPFKFRFNFYSNEKQHFHVDGTKFYIIIKPFKTQHD